MEKKTASAIMLALLLLSMLTLAFNINIQLVKAEPRTWTVDDDGPADFHTIQEAINAANHGDTIYVKSGTYSPMQIDKSLTIEGENRSTTIIDGGGVHETYISFMANNVQICNFTIQHLNCIYVDGYVNIGIFENIIVDNFQGIRLVHTSGNIIAGNVIDGNSAGDIGFDWANNTIVRNNTLTNSGGLAAIHGGYPSYNNSFIENKIIGNNLAVEMNNVFNDNKFCHNNFINNTIQVSFTGPQKVNSWDDGYPSGGNYWGDYTGNDDFSGSYQNETGSDGIGDAPYVIDSNNLDNYPLMNLWTPFDGGTIYIRADGSVDPSGASIHRKGNTYTLTGNITSNADGIVIERDNITLDGAGYSVQGAGGVNTKGIYPWGRSKVTVKNMEIKNFYIGIQLEGCSNSSISGNKIRANTGNGIWGWNTLYCSILGNIIVANGWTGIGLSGQSRFNNISGNDIESNFHNGIHFIAASDFNSVSGNYIAHNNDRGVALDRSGSNTVFENSIIANNVGILFFYSSNNTFYHNNFVYNSRTIDQWTPTLSQWDNGYPSGGNYWDDYHGVDVMNGPGQDLPGSDSIGDTPYIIDANNRDRYPLMSPYGAPSPQSYALTITATVGGTTDPLLGTYSYTANSQVQVTAILNTTTYLFDYWELDSANVGSANPYTVLMDKNHMLKAVFLPIPPPLQVSISPLSGSILVGQSVTFTSTVSGGYTPYSYQWYLNGNPVSGATSNTWTFIPTTSGIYYVYLEVTDSLQPIGNVTQSETARIIATTVPVGGYSYSVEEHATAKPLMPYLTLVAILTTVFTSIKRKTKREIK